MRARILYAIPVIVALFFACSCKANAQYWTYGFYSIVDNTGATLSSTTGAGFNAAGCSYFQSGATYILGCFGAGAFNGNLQQIYNYPPVETALIGSGRLCPNQPPLPFQEYDPTVYPMLNTCYEAAFDASRAALYSAGTPRCTPGQPSPAANPCELPYLFSAVASATSSSGIKLVPSQWQITYTDYSSNSQGVPVVVPCLEPNGSLTCTSYPLENGLQTGTLPFVTLTYAPAVTCVGFQAPFNNPIALPSKSKRAIPLIIQLLDSNNNVISPASLNGAVPVVMVSFSSGSSSAVPIPSSDLLSEGQASTGNQFTFNSSNNTWQFNLDTSPLMAPGTYTVGVQTGDGTQYALAGCSQTFTR